MKQTHVFYFILQLQSIVLASLCMSGFLYWCSPDRTWWIKVYSMHVCMRVCMYVYCMYRWLLSHPPITYYLYYYSLNNSIVIYDNWKGQWCLGVCLCDFVSILSLILKLIKTTFSKLLCLQVIISSHKISSAFNLIINSLSNFSTSLAPRISLSFFWEKVEVEKEEVEKF